MEEIKSVRVRTTDSNDIKITLYKSGNKRIVDGFNVVSRLGESEYKGSRYNDFSDNEIISDYLSVVEKRENRVSGYYKVIQDPWEEKAPVWRSYGFDPYYLNNGSKVIISWLDSDNISTGGKEWSDENGNELDIKRGMTQSTKSFITKTVTIIPSNDSSDKKTMIIKDSSISDSFETGQKFSGNTSDLSIITQIISYWKNKVPNYEIELCNPNNEFCNIIPYKSPINEFVPDGPEPVPTEESTQTQGTPKIKLSIVLPEDLNIKVKQDFDGLKVYIGNPPSDGFVFQDDFDNLEELDPIYMETSFVGEEETNAVADEPDPQQLNEEQEVDTPTSSVTGAPLTNSKLLISSKSGRYYILSTSNGAAGHRLKNILTDLEKYLNNNGFPGTKLSNNGVMRDLEASAVPGNPARAKGSLHGAGLAIDLKFSIPGKSWKGIGDNGNLAKDSKLNKAIYKWVTSQGDLTWGGQWGKSKPGDGLVKGWGITEYHHFEIKSSKIPEYWKPFESELSSLGFDYKKLNTTTNLQKLYLKLLGKGGGSLA